MASKHPFRRPHDFLTGFLASDRPIAAFDGSRDAFVGGYGTLKEPIAVVRGRCSNTRGSSDATVGAVQFDLVLEQGQEESVSLVLGATDQEGRIASLRERYLGHSAEFFAQLAADKAAMVAANRVKTPDPLFDQMVNVWIKQGARYGSRWCRWGWNGYRDIVQHGLGVSAQLPGRTRSILLEALRDQFSNGLALRVGTRSMKSPTATAPCGWSSHFAHISRKPATPLLAEEVPYYDGGLASVLDHVRTTLDFLEHNKGAHGLVLIKFGDWNDSLTGVGKEGRGESVWLSIAYAEACVKWRPSCGSWPGPKAEADYARRRGGIVAAINEHAWDGQWYLRCFDDDGRAIGSQQNRFGRIFMEPQSWALDCRHRQPGAGVPTVGVVRPAALDGAGLHAAAPPFTELDPNIGRISSMEPGICENGTVYTHVNIWMILGLLRLGMADKACELFHRITPASLSGPEDPKQHHSFQYANCYFGPQHKNRACSRNSPGSPVPWPG